MRVVHVSTEDVRGGAARAAMRLHLGLLQAGIDSHLAVMRQAGKIPNCRVPRSPRHRGGRVLRRMARRARRLLSPPAERPLSAGWEKFTTLDVSVGRRLLPLLADADVVNLHWVADFLDYRLLPELATPPRRLVWTLHDMNAFTGGCHYDEHCGRFREICHACPQLQVSGPHDLANAVFTRKMRLFDSLTPEQLQIVSPSRWLLTEARRSRLLRRFPSVRIPYGIDLDELAPRDQLHARGLFDIPAEPRVLLFVAESVANPRKGLQSLFEAVGRLRDRRDLAIASLGQGALDFDAPCPVFMLGHIRNDRLLSAAYSAADVFVIPSLQDNLPNTAIEALACGTPVVGFDVGGLGDIVRPGETGLLAPSGDIMGLAGAIRRILDDDDTRERMSLQCRRVAQREYGLSQQALRYQELYTRLLDRGAGRDTP